MSSWRQKSCKMLKTTHPLSCTIKILCDSDTCMTFIFKAFTGFETNNKYKICNSMGQQVYFAAEGILNKSNNSPL